MVMEDIITVQILKNGQPLKEFKCEEKKLHITFATAHSIAGGLWNGVDAFSVKINK
jgi:hypothetical protein